ncbi:MAG: hypothetical protein ACR2JB_21545 [Bryobacteraceae bacterium]
MSDVHSDATSKKPRTGRATEPKTQRATGPKTPGGKARSSQNSTKHSCCSKKPLIKGESEKEFNELLEDWKDDYRPRGKSARELVRQAAEAQWVLKRNTHRYHELEESLQDKKALEWTEEEHKKMERFIRYRTTAERSFWRVANALEQSVKRRQKRVEEREEEAEQAEAEQAEAKQAEAKQAEAEQAEAEEAVEEVPEVMQRKPDIWDIEVGAVHVLDQWADVTIEKGRTVTRLEPSTEQLFEDRATMKPPPEHVCRRFTFYDGVPEEYGWCAGLYNEIEDSPKYGVQHMTIETWLQALEREKAAGTGHLSDTGEDLPDPKRRGWCWCTVCARTTETGWRREKESDGKVGAWLGEPKAG